MKNHLNLSQFTCAVPKCTRRIKKSIIERKTRNKNLLCFNCYKQKELHLFGHQMRTAKEIRKNPELRSKKRKQKHIPLKTN